MCGLKIKSRVKSTFEQSFYALKRNSVDDTVLCLFPIFKWVTGATATGRTLKIQKAGIALWFTFHTRLHNRRHLLEQGDPLL